MVELGNSSAEGGGNTGSDFAVASFDDSGALLGVPLLIRRTDSMVITSGFSCTSYMDNSGGILKNGKQNTAGTPIMDWRCGTGADYDVRLIANPGTGADGKGTLQVFGKMEFYGAHHHLFVDGLAGGYYDTIGGQNRFFAGSDGVADLYRIYSAGAGNAITVAYNGVVTLAYTLNAAGINASSFASPNDAGVRVQVAAGGYARFNSTVIGVRTYQWGADPSGNFVLTDESAGAFRLTLNPGGTWDFGVNPIRCGISYATARATKQGTNGGYEAPMSNFSWGAGYKTGWIDVTAVGVLQPYSDYRVKKDVIDLPGMWDTVKALRPIKYTQATFSPPSHVAYVAKQKAKAEQYAKTKASEREGEDPVVPGELYLADDNERWGFIAHELQETLVPTAATGVKDQDNLIQTPNPFTVIAALTKALQEAMVRIEALEATR